MPEEADLAAPLKVILRTLYKAPINTMKLLHIVNEDPAIKGSREFSIESLTRALAELRSRHFVHTEQRMRQPGAPRDAGLVFHNLTAAGKKLVESDFKRKQTTKRSPSYLPEAHLELNDPDPNLFKYTFQDFPKPFVEGEKVNLLLVLAHSDMEAQKSIPPDKIERFQMESKPEYLRDGNFSDSQYVPFLVATLLTNFFQSNPDGVINREALECRTDLEVDMATVGGRNVITVGAGNVNALTRRILFDFERQTRTKLPIHFEDSKGHYTLTSELSGKSYSYEDFIYRNRCHGMVLLLPNIYSNDENRVILVIAGTEIEGTIAGVLSLCERKDVNGKEIGSNNDKDGRFPAKIVRAIVKSRSVKSALFEYTRPDDPIITKETTVTGFEFKE